MKLLEEILSDYPRVWEYYKHDAGEKNRGPKFSQRYPLPLATLSMILDFHKWTHKTTYLVAGELQQALPVPVRRTDVGPCPLVMSRIRWLDYSWEEIVRKRKSLSKTLGDEIVHWHTRIRIKVNDGDTYTYESEMACESCAHRSVMRINDKFVCVNTGCKNPLTGEFRTWLAH
jgi:hypothetical protein